MPRRRRRAESDVLEVVHQAWKNISGKAGTTLTLALLARWPEGSYEVRLLAPAGGPDELLATYVVRIEYDGPDVRNGE